MILAGEFVRAIGTQVNDRTFGVQFRASFLKATALRTVWQRLFEHLAAEPDNEYAMLDSTIVPAHQHSAGAPKKRR